MSSEYGSSQQDLVCADNEAMTHLYAKSMIALFFKVENKDLHHNQHVH